MKKVLLIAAVILLVTNLTKSQVLTEKFENWPPTAWEFYELSTSQDGWEQTTSGIDGSFGLTHPDGSPSSDFDSWIISPLITDLPTNSVLTFYEKNKLMRYYGYSGVLVSTESGNPSDSNFVELYESSEQISDYTEKNIDLSSYSGNDIYIAFRYAGQYAHEWNIDEIDIKSTPANDISLSLETDTTGWLISSQTLNINLANKGLQNVNSNTPVYLNVDATPVDTIFTEENLTSFEKELLTFNLDISPGYHQIKIFSEQDDNSSNDTVEISTVFIEENQMIETFGNGFPLGWNTNSFKYVYNDGIGDNDHLYSGENESFIITPKLAVTENSFIGFYVKDFFSDGTMAIYYKETGSDSWIPFKSGIPTTSMNYLKYVFDLSELAGNNTWFKFVFSNNIYSSINLDHLLLPAYVEEKPNPAILQTNDFQDIINQKIEWTSDSNSTYVTNYILNFGTNGDGTSQPSNIINGELIDEEFYQLPDLEFDTDYYVQIISENNSGSSSNNTIYTLRTPEKPFMSIGDTINFNQEMPFGWYQYNVSLDENDSISITNRASNFDIDTYAYLPDSTNSLYLNLWTTHKKMLVLPDIILGDTIHNPSVSFNMAIINFNNEMPDTLDLDDRFGIMIAENGSWKLDNSLFEITHKDSIGLYKRIELNLNDYSDTIQLAIYGISMESVNDVIIFLDNFTIDQVSENSALSWLKINDTIPTVFSRDLYDYEFMLPEGIESIPVISAKAEDTDAEITISQPDNINGTAMIVVEAPNKNFTSSYSVKFNEYVYQTSAIATLDSIVVNGKTIAGFEGNINDYNVVLPFDASNVPIVKGYCTDDSASISYLQATSVLDTAKIIVTAEDGVTNHVYRVSFRKQSNVALLDSICINNALINGFNPNTFTYCYYLNEGEEIPSEINIFKQDSLSTVSFENAVAINDSAEIVVTAESGNQNFYYVRFEQIISSNDELFMDSDIQFYPNPVISTLYFQDIIDEIKIMDLHGKTILSESSVNNLNVHGLVKGIYLLKISKGEKEQTYKLIKH